MKHSFAVEVIGGVSNGGHLVFWGHLAWSILVNIVIKHDPFSGIYISFQVGQINF